MVKMSPIRFTPGWGGKWFTVQGHDIENLEIEQTIREPDRVRITIIGDSAELALQVLGDAMASAPPIIPNPLPQPVNHQDEVLAAARRDRQDAERRATAAEQEAARLREENADYEGEVAALREELEAEKSKVLLGVDPAGFARGGIVSAGTAPLPSGRYNASMVNYSKADAALTQKIFDAMNRKAVRAKKLDALEKELEKYDPFTYGDSS